MERRQPAYFEYEQYRFFFWGSLAALIISRFPIIILKIYIIFFTIQVF
jgi:hypothetical protein